MPSTPTYVFALVVLFHAAAIAQEPKPPPSDAQTTQTPSAALNDEELAQLDALAASIDDLILAGKYTSASEAAAKALELKTRQRGKRHFETQDAQRRLNELREPLRQVPLQRLIDELPVLKKKVLELLEAGQAREALRLVQVMRTTSEYAFPYRDLRSTQYMDLLAKVYESLGRIDEAEAWYSSAAYHKKEALGSLHPSVAQSLAKSGEMRLRQSKYSEAADDFWEALQIRVKALGESHPDTVTSQHQLANCYHRILRGQPELHPSERREFTLLGAVFGLLNKASNAESFYKEALTNRRRLLPADHPDLAVTLHGLAVLHHTRGEFESAEPLYLESLKIIERAFGTKHSNTAIILSDLAHLYFLHDEKDKAVALLRRAVIAHDVSRMTAEKPSEKLFTTEFNPRCLLAVIEQSNDPNLAFELVESVHSRGLIDHPLLADHRLTTQERSQLAELRTTRASAQSKILASLAQNNRTSEQVSLLEQLLGGRDEAASSIKKIATDVDARNTASVEEIQSKLPEDSALLFWVDVESRSMPLTEHWGCIVRPGKKAIWERLPGQSDPFVWSWQYGGLPTEVRSRLAGHSGDYRYRGHTYPIGGAGESALARQRFSSLQKHLSGVKRIYAVPGAVMAGIPLELLAPEFEFSYVPSGTALVRPPPPRSREADVAILAVGDAHYPRWEARPEQKRPWGGIPIVRVGKQVSEKYNIHAGDWLVNCGGYSYGHDKDPITKGMESYRTFGKTVPLRLWRQIENGKTYEWTVNVPIEPLEIELCPQDKIIDYHLDHEFYNERLVMHLRSSPSTYNDRFEVRHWDTDICSSVELAKLKSIFGQRGKYLEWSQASEQNLIALQKNDQLKNFRYLHLATNGIPNSSAPFESFLTLAQDQIARFDKEKPADYVNGELSAKEVLSWKLDADLVVISNFKLHGDFTGGCDGMLAMAQAFLTAGARSVLITPCDTNDLATWLLLDRFYQNLEGKRAGLTEPMKKSAGLREAKSWLKSLTHPDLERLVPEFTKGIQRANGEPLSEELIQSRFWLRPDLGEFKAFSRLDDFPTFILIGDPD